MLARFRPSPAMVVACAALAIALGGSAYAVTALPNNSVGTKQLKNGAVTTKKIKKAAVTGVKIKVSTLGTVPRAARAAHASIADALAPPESWHQVGAPGQPDFQNGWNDIAPNASLPNPEKVAFYKDREGVVHLKGTAVGGAQAMAIFQLLPGYRPAPGKYLEFVAACTACTATDPQGSNVDLPTGRVTIFGRGFGIDGTVAEQDPLVGSKAISLDGIAFRAAG